jgi:hypothetical protein
VLFTACGTSIVTPLYFTIARCWVGQTPCRAGNQGGLRSRLGFAIVSITTVPNPRRSGVQPVALHSRSRCPFDYLGAQGDGSTLSLTLLTGLPSARFRFAPISTNRVRHLADSTGLLKLRHFAEVC